MRYLSFIIVLLLGACNKSTKILHSCFQLTERVHILKLSEFKSANEFVMTFREFHCDEYSTIVSIDEKHNLLFADNCPNNGISCYRLRNILRIVDDSITMDKNYPISDIDSLVYQHIHNCNNEDHFSQHPLKSIFSIEVERLNILEFQNVLLNLIHAFDKADAPHCLYLLLDNLNPIAPPISSN